MISDAHNSYGPERGRAKYPEGNAVTGLVEGVLATSEFTIFVIMLCRARITLMSLRSRNEPSEIQFFGCRGWSVVSFSAWFIQAGWSNSLTRFTKSLCFGLVRGSGFGGPAA
jgi:hypothetical protein